jgi:hypothetical protein
MPVTVPYRKPIPTDCDFAAALAVTGDDESREYFIKGLRNEHIIPLVEQVARRGECFILSRMEGGVLYLSVDPRHNDLVSREEFDVMVRKSLDKLGYLKFD